MVIMDSFISKFWSRIKKNWRFFTYVKYVHDIFIILMKLILFWIRSIFIDVRAWFGWFENFVMTSTMTIILPWILFKFHEIFISNIISCLKINVFSWFEYNVSRICRFNEVQWNFLSVLYWLLFSYLRHKFVEFALFANWNILQIFLRGKLSETEKLN